MGEYVFKSALTIEEIEKNFENVNFFDGLMGGLKDALAIEKGDVQAEAFRRKRMLPDDDVSEVRKALSLTQKSFACMLGVSTRTVESWEAGRTTPTPTARKLIHLISQDKEIASKLMEM